MSTLFTEPAGSGESASPMMSAATEAATDGATDSFVSRTPTVPVPAPVESLHAATLNSAVAERAMTARRFELTMMILLYELTSVELAWRVIADALSRSVPNNHARTRYAR